MGKFMIFIIIGLVLNIIKSQITNKCECPPNVSCFKIDNNFEQNNQLFQIPFKNSTLVYQQVVCATCGYSQTFNQSESNLGGVLEYVSINSASANTTFEGYNNNTINMGLLSYNCINFKILKIGKGSFVIHTNKNNGTNTIISKVTFDVQAGTTADSYNYKTTLELTTKNPVSLIGNMDNYKYSSSSWIRISILFLASIFIIL